ncbi:MAG: hypothetical protein JOY61_02005 [Chloroflexi bacterium]|nr:hypothetical protein [Chloroflexota bacterium]
MTTIVRITRDESWLAAGTNYESMKSAHHRHQVAAAFGRDTAHTSEWHTPADAVAVRLAAAIADAYGTTRAASMTRIFSHVLLATVSQAEHRSADAPICFVDLIRESDGKRAYTAFGGAGSLPEPVEGFTVERSTTVNVSFLIRAVRVAAARNRLVGFDAPMMPAPDSTEYAVIMAPYAEAALPDVVEEVGMKKAEMAARRAGSLSRSIAMGGTVKAGARKPSKAA